MATDPDPVERATLIERAARALADADRSIEAAIDALAQLADYTVARELIEARAHLRRLSGPNITY
jgi:hypothetical protein